MEFSRPTYWSYVVDPPKTRKLPQSIQSPEGVDLILSRDGRIRTGDPLNPIQVRYRAAPRPVVVLPSRKYAVLPLPVNPRRRTSVHVGVHVGGSQDFPKLTNVQNGLQDSRRISLLVEILHDLVGFPSSRFRYVLKMESQWCFPAVAFGDPRSSRRSAGNPWGGESTNGGEALPSAVTVLVLRKQSLRPTDSTSGFVE